MTKPNIIFILLDDFGWKDSSCYGSSFYETPNVDLLFKQGMHFTDAYAACPVCSPTRASIMSGKYPATVGITDWIDAAGTCHPRRGKVVDVPYLKALPTSEKSLASALRDGGYKTWHIGKWHLGGTGHLPQDHGFDLNLGGGEMGHPHHGYFSPWQLPDLPEENVPAGTYLTDYLGDKAVELIQQHATQSSDKPFFLNMSFYSVHTPIQAKAETIEKFRLKAKEMCLDQLPTFKDGELFPFENKGNGHVKRRLLQSDSTYAAMIEHMDENVGKIMTAIKENNLAQNTIIFFTSDNGGLNTSEGSPTCNAPLAEGKGWMYEGGTREPLIAWWPNHIRAGSACSVPVTSPDFYPTLLELAQLEPIPSQHSDGVSILPLLKEENNFAERDIFWHYPHYGNQGGTPGSSVRRGNFKLIEFFEDGRCELYNLSEDIGESNNLIDQQPQIAKQMIEALHSWQKSVEAKIPLPNPDYCKANS